MTWMLASVATAAEARLAVTLGADIIDLKDPARGALGALPAATVRDIVAAVAGARPTSATIGDLPMEPEQVCRAVERTAARGVGIVKVGVFPGGAPEEAIAGLAPLAARGLRLVIVLFADRRPDLSLLPPIAGSGCLGVMLDTADKSSGGLRRSLDGPALADFLGRARGLGLMAGLAGSLTRADIAPLLDLAPDYLGFRGALCAGALRAGRLEPTAVEAVRAAIPRDRRPMAALRQISWPRAALRCRGAGLRRG